MEDRYTWSDLKNFCNSLPEEELEKQVHWWGDERGGKVYRAYQLPEDFIETDYGCEPLSAQEPPEDDEEYVISYAKGTPILDTD